MAIIFTLFYGSLAIIITMIGWKIVSLRSLKLSLIEGIEKELHGKFYDIAHAWWDTFRLEYWARVRVFAVALFYTIAHEAIRLALLVGQKFKVRLHKWHDMVKGKGVIKNKGSVSFFLQDIAEHKKSMQSESQKS